MNKLTKTIPVGALALILGAMPSPALADYYQKGGSETTTCIKKVYREEYIPGTSKSNPGRVRSWYERKKVPCETVSSAPKRARRTHHHPTWIEPHSGGNAKSAPPVDDNSCIEGSIIGGIAGGAAGGTLATKKNWIWSIPLGVVSGAMVGCQVDGG
jgi:hypothetical protein